MPKSKLDLKKQFPELYNPSREPHITEIPEMTFFMVDGTGYPEGIRGEDIPLEARILSVADVFDALTSERHYRNRMEFIKVISILDQNSGTHFDVNCVNAFKKFKLDTLVNILEYDSDAKLDDEDLAFLSNYEVAHLFEVCNNNSDNGADKLIETIFNKYYNKTYS